MGKQMTTRERVVRTMSLQETDRVPVYDVVRNDAAFEHFSGDKLPSVTGDQRTAAALSRINEAWHEHGMKCLFHSDGYLMEVMDDLVAAGIDGLNPIETVAGMDLKDVKDRYGDRIFLAGGIDMSQLMSRGSVDAVRQVCRQAIGDAYPGYFIGSTTELDNSCRLECIIAMVETAQRA